MLTVITVAVFFRIDGNQFAAFTAGYLRQSSHITALQTMVEPCVFIDIDIHITVAFGAFFCFPHNHFIHPPKNRYSTFVIHTASTFIIDTSSLIPHQIRVCNFRLIIMLLKGYFRDTKGQLKMVMNGYEGTND
jgi:hypothetical protein